MPIVSFALVEGSIKCKSALSNNLTYDKRRDFERILLIFIYLFAKIILQLPVKLKETFTGCLSRISYGLTLLKVHVILTFSSNI